MPDGLPRIEGVPWEPYPGPPPGPPKTKPGWTVVFTGARLDQVREVWIGPRHLRGPGTVDASVTVGGDKRVSIRDVDARFEKASSSLGGQQVYSDLTFRLRGRMEPFYPKETKGLALLPLVHARVEIDGRLPSGAAALDYYLRNAPWVTFSGGEARLSARLEVAGGRLKGSDLAFDAAGVETAGIFSLSLVVSRGDLLALTFGVDGTRLDLERFNFASRHEQAGVPDWSGHVAFPEARLDMSDAVAAEGRVDVRASDTRPLVAFPSARNPLRGWEKKLLSIEEIRGGGRFRLAGRALGVEGFEVKGGKIAVRVNARVTEKGAFGRVLASYGAASVGIELRGQERDLRVLRPEHWFESR
jgi:hypothetical protein